MGVLAVVGIAAFAMWYFADTAPPANDVVVGNSTALELVPYPAPSVEDTEAPSAAEDITSSRLMVEIQGAVASPGVYSFPAEARVHDALEKAGGALEYAEIRDINIAAALVDGSVLSVPYQQQERGPQQPGAADLNPPGYTRSGWTDTSTANVPVTTGGALAPVSAKVNINTATQAELETLPGVGEKTAEKIMRHRETQRFTQVDDLGFVQGIGEKRLETLRPHVTVE
jgi:competence protein ComEA